MERRVKVLIAVGTALGGLVLGSGFTWTALNGSDGDGVPLRAVRSPCNVVTAEELEAVLPDAHVLNAGIDVDPGGSSMVTARCSFGARGETGGPLELFLRRYGPRSRDTDPGKATDIEVTPAATVARKEYLRRVAGPDGCTPSPVTGVGELAAACSGDDHGTPAHRVIALRGDLVLEVTGRARAAGKARQLRSLAATVLEGSR